MPALRWAPARNAFLTPTERGLDPALCLCPTPHPCRRLPCTTRWGTRCRLPAAWGRCRCRWPGRRSPPPGRRGPGTGWRWRRRGLHDTVGRGRAGLAATKGAGCHARVSCQGVMPLLRHQQETSFRPRLKGGLDPARCLCPMPYPCRRLPSTTRWGTGCRLPAAWERYRCRWPGRRCGSPGSSWTGMSRCRQRRGLFGREGRQGGQAAGLAGEPTHGRWGGVRGEAARQ
jgi:hypothetical protein